ncbi:asparagine synthase-related protein [uncultured Desulfovibrio sp.]|uniref:asparagine synthase-related protein n=1 Tax=uncultured Desulfovibrio sp. TaxID=167968 RepID=UPI0026DC8FD4|nr:asparagine synthase-related protein [uncultured Desulfovibrio sp.]
MRHHSHADGQGADELLAGYQGYPGQRLASLLRAGHLLTACHFSQAASRWPDRGFSYILQRTIGEFVPEKFLQMALKLVGRDPLPRWLDMAHLTEQGVRPLPQDMREVLFPSPHKVKQKLATQLVWCGLPQLLRHGDRNAMAHSIESRVPFLTQKLAEFCLSLPEHYLVDDQGCSKSIFRSAMCGIVPDAILDRRDKIGFATPERQWLETLAPWVDDILAQAGTVPFLRMDMVRQEWQAIRTGKNAFNWRVWRWLCAIPAGYSCLAFRNDPLLPAMEEKAILQCQSCSRSYPCFLSSPAEKSEMPSLAAVVFPRITSVPLKNIATIWNLPLYATTI